MKIKITPLVLLALSTSLANAVPMPAFTLTKVLGFRNDSWSFGEKFVVGATDITVDALGFIDVGRDGFVNLGHDVGIYKESGTLLTSTTVLGTDPLVSDFRYHGISPITLFAGQAYRVIGVNNDDLYNIDSSPVIVDPRITRTGYAYGNSTTLQFLNDFHSAERLWVANFNIGGSVTAPDSGSTAFLAILGIAGMIAVRRKLS